MNKYAKIKAMTSKKPRGGFVAVPVHAGHHNRTHTQPQGQKPMEEFTGGIARRSPAARALKEKIRAVKARRFGGGSYDINKMKAELHALCGRRK